MQQYLLSIYQGDGDPPGPEILDPIMANLAALNQEMKAAGAWVFSAGLHPASTATVLRPRDGEVLVTDGPYTEGKEHLGGFTVIQAPDLDAALEWGAKLARAIGLLPIEVRPLADEADSCDPPGA
ncbi:YciI family protein [Plantactinospora sp. WMMB782]|uniref:YciI family protein n=1 Tax=Plantactinospora sp. WMMB782 TaxID=3404121 RepID=UPI003B92A6EE